MFKNATKLFVAAAMLGAFAAPGAQSTSAQAPVDRQPDPKKWDVGADLGPSQKLAFDTSEGTWMNVDVSPDGRQVVFDLLGDIYMMPAGGSASSQATRITSGAAFDMQPRFSPDGKRIAFASDRDGLWNIWTMDVEGKNAKQVSRERRWFINSPTWAPDGNYIFARRHFVAQRSLGAGEIWMFHAAGSDGLQVTEKNGFQKDAGEPAISPDGRYLYYSKDVTPGQNFEYNKDPNGTIYAIIRRDLNTGRERTAVSVQGGSVTPRVSPDGTSLAYVRRVRLGSQLYVRDLATGRDRSIFDRLDKDLQEAWAVHGLYPQYAWMPDGKAILIWGEGKIWRVDVASGKGAPVPFTARVEQTVNDAVRFEQKVHTPEFQVKALRNVAVSPDGKRVTYGALGYLYVKDLPGGQPKRVTKSEAFEFAPRWSADGQWIVHTTWTDANYGRVRVVRPDGTAARDVVPAPGHYTEPAFSPDGKWIVFRNTGPDGTRGPLYGGNSGIYVVPADGSSLPRLVREGGSDPSFDATGKRIFVNDFRQGKAVLVSVGIGDPDSPLSGGDDVVHFQSDNATQIVPSPDGKWVAFAERWHAFVAPFPHTGRAIDLSPTMEGYPTARISQDAGFNIHWSGDNRKVYWSLGPELFTRDLGRTFTFLQPEEAAPRGVIDAPEARGVNIGFTTAADAPSGAIAFVGARIIFADDRAGKPLLDAPEVIENGTVVVEGNRITAVGRNVAIPAGAHRVDARGKTIMPGIIDVHGHVGGEGDGILSQASWPLAANLAFGVTTTHDPSNDTETVFSNAELVRAGMKLGPRVFSTGTILYGAETPFKAVINNYEDALSTLRRQKAYGAFSVKSYNQQRRDARQMIIKAARELQMEVVPEGGSLLYMNETMVLDGHTTVEHSLPVPKLYKDVVTLFGKSRTGYTPTLIVGYGGLSGEFYWYQKTNVWENAHLLTFTPREVVDARSRRRTMAPDEDFNHVLIAKGAKQILDAGGLVHLGAHGQLQGLGAHWELWMLQQGGMTNAEAIRCATINGAKALGLDKDLGSIEKGKLADLIVLDRNPLENIRNSESISMVMLNGRLYDAQTLNEIGNHPKERLKLYLGEVKGIRPGAAPGSGGFGVPSGMNRRDPLFVRPRRLLASFGVLALLWLAAGCDSKPKAVSVSADTWATVDGRSIMRDDVEKTFRRTQDAAATLSPEEAMTVKLSVLNEMVVQDILLAKAGVLKIDVSASELDAAYAERKKNLTDAAFEEELKKRQLSAADMREGVRRELLAKKLLDQEVVAKVTVTDQEVNDFFNANRAQFTVAEESYRIAQIVITPERAAQPTNRTGNDATTPQEAAFKVRMVMERLQAGARFSEVAMDYSEDPESAQRGGDLGLVPMSALKQAPEPLRKAVIGKTPGTVNVVTAGGIHTLVLVLAHETAGERGLSTPGVKEGITQTLKDRKEQLLRTAYLSAARGDATVVNHVARRVLESQGKVQ